MKRQQAAEAEKVARQKDEEAKRKAAEIARQQEEARKAAELAAKQKAEAERKARELARQKAEEASHQANAKPKRRRRRAILPRPPAPVFSLDDYDAKDNSESSIGNLARVIPRMGRELINDYEEIPLEELEDEAEEERRQATQFQPKSRNRRAISSEPSSDEDASESVSTSDKHPQDNTELHEKVETAGLQPRAAQPRTQAAAQADAVSTNTNSALSDAMASTQSILLDTGASLTRHIAQKSRADAEKNSVWMSNTGYGRDYASAQYRRFSSKRTQTQIGIDRSLSENMQIGGVLTYSDSQHTFDQASGKNTFVQANLYGKYYLNDAWYVAGDIGAGSLRSRLQTQQKANFNRTSIQTGLTLGNTLKINQFEIVPSAGIRYSRLSSADYKLGDDSVKVSSMAVKTLTAGLDFAYRFKVGNLTVKPLLSAAYFANYGKGGVNVGGKSFAYKADNQQQYSAGAALLYRNVTLNVNGSITKGKQLEKQKSGQIKIQIRF